MNPAGTASDLAGSHGVGRPATGEVFEYFHCLCFSGQDPQVGLFSVYGTSIPERFTPGSHSQSESFESCRRSLPSRLMKSNEHARHPGTASTPAGRLTLLALHVGMYR